MGRREQAAGAEEARALARDARGGGLVAADDLRELAPLAEAIDERIDEILERWRGQYERFLGAEPTVATDDIAGLLRRDLEGMREAARECSVAPFAAAARSIGNELLNHGVPFARAVGAVCFLSEAALSVLDCSDACARVLEKLGHYRILEFADQYFRCGVDPAPLADDAGAAARAGGAAAPAELDQRHGLVGNSPPMTTLFRRIEAAAKGRSTVFIVGESGTGKELAARAVHARSSRSNRPLVVVNCAALPAGLFESELFGHSEGAYTGAQRSYSGLVRAAAGGTLFLDEITEMPASVQAKLLRVLEEGTVRPVGTTQEIPAQVRFVASTNRDPEQAVRAGVLRADVYHRINVHRIDTPPLRDHLDDIPALVYYFAKELAVRGFRPVTRFHADSLALMQQYSWPGNVRELRNAVEVALTSGTGEVVRPGDLPSYILRARSTRDGIPRTAVPTFAESERSVIQRALAATSGNKRRAAQLLGISRHRLYDKIRKYQIETSPQSLRSPSPDRGREQG